MLLNGTGELIDDYEYPATTEELIEAHGDRTLELANGTERVEEVLTRLESETFETSEDARFAIYAAVSDKAVGRVGYSDRDPTPVGSPYSPDALSF
ncbi:DUF5789 family protein [Halobiforma nitratireducens]|uniref:DUF2795 domain-containing protein n=1 Tax=Halobiforma nitratireducens JCM 10879 TaxID=1227454 RepID=M0LYG3_9EURY|nr:hypothetical protein [Halobiforma nitratireducens]EMA38218.1 hypothetical protein C446_10225 [Halobiforma nitratireducens JCM 10879]